MGSASVRGLAATRALPASSTLLRVPLRCTIRDTHVPEAFPGSPWNVNMAAFLLAECGKQRAAGSATAAPKSPPSWYWPYISSMPGMGSWSPLLFDGQELVEVGKALVDPFLNYSKTFSTTNLFRCSTVQQLKQSRPTKHSQNDPMRIGSSISKALVVRES